MNTLTIRTLGLPWLAAVVLTGLAMMALAGQAILPPGSLRLSSLEPAALTVPPTAPSGGTAKLPDPFSLMTTQEHGALRDQLSAIRSLLNAPGGDPDTLAVSQARARLAALIAAQDQSGTDAPQALALTGLISRIDSAVSALHQAASQELPANDALLKLALGLAFAAALLALLAGPLAISPAHRLTTSLSLAAHGEGTIWGTERTDDWGALARMIACLRDGADASVVALPQHTVLSGPTDKLRETAEAMSRLLLDSGQELARMRGEAGEAVNNAVMLGARLADAVLDAESRLQARGQWTAGAATAGETASGTSAAALGLPDASMLFTAAAAHADRLEEAATRALAAATVLPAAADRIEQAIAGLDRMAETVAANSEGLADLAARAGAAAAMLPEAAERIEAAAAGLGGVVNKTSSAAAVLPQAAQLIAQASSDLGRAAEAVAANAAGLNEAVARHTDAASTLPTVAERIEGVVAVLDRSTVALGDATDHARISSRAAAEAANNNETVQRSIVEAAQSMAALGEQLPGLAHHIVDATQGLYQGVNTVMQAAARAEEASQTVAAMASGNEAAQQALAGTAQRMAVLGEQLPSLASQIVDASNSLDQSAATVLAVTTRADETSRTVAALTSTAEAAQTALAGVAQRMASFGEELPGIAFQIAEATTNMDKTAGTVREAADRAEQTTTTIASVAANANAAHEALSATLPHLVAASANLPELSQRLETAVVGFDDSRAVLVAAQGVLAGTLPQVTASIERLPVIAGQFEAVLGTMHGTTSIVVDAANSALEAGRTAEASVTEAAAAQAALTANLRQTVEQASQILPTLLTQIDESVNSLQSCQASVVEVTAGALRASELTLANQTSLTSAVECIVSVGDGLAEKVPVITAGLGEQIDRLDQFVTGARNANIAVSVRQIAQLASTMTETLSPISTRISAAVTDLEGSAASLSRAGEMTEQALPAAAARIDEALAGLDATVQIIAGAAQTAAASMTESASTQSALAQTVQCMASVGEALPSLAMRIEGTLGALDRSTDTIVAAANDVAVAGRALGASHAGADDGNERKMPANPNRPVVDAASMRRLQTVASALAMAGNGSRG